MSRPRHGRRRHSVRRGVALACVFAGVLATGAATGSWPQDAAGGAEPAADTADGVPGDDAARVVGRSGDPWATAYSAEEYERVRHALAGEYVGTGIAVVRTAAGRIEVGEVHEDSPAERAGVRAGDTIRAVDGERVDGWAVTDAVARLRGSDEAGQAGPGSTVVLDLERDGHRWRAEIARARLVSETVTVTRDAPGVTRVRVASFTQGAARLLRDAVDGAPDGDRLILDLRGNAGGLLSEAAGAASVFLDGGLVATYDVRGEQHALHAEPGGDTATPLVVLVDGGTMSSAELVTGALQDRGRAVVVGTRTFGKGTVQMPSTQPDGSVAELTVGHYATPSGRVVDEGGLEPDLAVEPGDDPLARALTVLDGLGAGG